MVVMLMSGLRDNIDNENGQDIAVSLSQWDNKKDNIHGSTIKNKNILKLAKLGWSIEEISKVLRISKEKVANIIENKKV
jgi:DNA-binding NarL/FixJ family response regulator